MRITPLQSGSSGNCVLVECGDTKILIDAGIGQKAIVQRLNEHGCSPEAIDAIFVTHEHSDHVRGLAAMQKRFATETHLTTGTAQALSRKGKVASEAVLRPFFAGASISMKNLIVHSIPTEHDARDGVCFTVESVETGHRCGLWTDLGHVFGELREALPSLDGLLIESNFDPGLLRSGPYPAYLKHRIDGPKGHLSNQDAAELVGRHAGPRLRWVCLGHLSEKNNCPDLAARTHRRVAGEGRPVYVASRTRRSETLTLGGVETSADVARTPTQLSFPLAD